MFLGLRSSRERGHRSPRQATRRSWGGVRRARSAAAALNSAAISWAELEAHLVIASMSIASKVSEGRLMLSGLERPAD